MWRCLVVVAMLWIGGCASLPVDYERTVSHALQDTGDTRLVRSGRAALQAHAGQNAFRPLPDGVEFNLVIYGAEADVWRRAMVPSGPSARDDALKFLRGYRAKGKRDVATGLLAAFDLALPKRGKTPVADTVFLVAAAPPDTGPTFSKYFNVLDAVLSANATLGIRVHTCGPSPTNFGNYLARIAAQFGGRHAG